MSNAHQSGWSRITGMARMPFTRSVAMSYHAFFVMKALGVM